MREQPRQIILNICVRNEGEHEGYVQDYFSLQELAEGQWGKQTKKKKLALKTVTITGQI